MLNHKSQSCKHQDVRFLQEDNHFVCLECGFVVSDYALMDHKIDPLKWTKITKETSLPSTCMTHYSLFADIDRVQNWDFDLLERVCSNFFIPACIEEEVRYKLGTKEYETKKNGRSQRCHSLMAFALYSSCIEADCVKLPEQITSWFQISLKRFWDVHKEFNYKQRKIMPGDVLKMIKSEVQLIDPQLSYKNYVDITNISNMFASNTCNSPSVVLAACLYVYLSEKRKVKITVSHIAKLCHVSCTSVNNLRKKINLEHLFYSLNTYCLEQNEVKKGEEKKEVESRGRRVNGRSL